MRPRLMLTLMMVIAALPWGARAAATDLSPQSLLEAASAAGGYLARSTLRDGRFIYLEDPAQGAVDEYNMLRHAGTIWSMLELHEAAPDPALLATAELAMVHLASHAQPIGDGRRGKTMVIVTDREVKLGGNALAALALTAHHRATGSRLHLPMAQRLGEWILQTQEPSGRFAVHSMQMPLQRVDDFRSEYYDGEAALALLRLHRVTNDVRYLDGAGRAVRYIITVRDAGRADADLPPDHWLLYAMSELHAQRPDPLLVDHTRRVVKRVQMDQHGEGAPAEWVGGWYDPPRSTPAAARSEGLAAAWQMFHRIGDKATADSIFATLEAATKFQLSCQITPAMAAAYRDPQRVVGAFRGGPTAGEIRIDYVQHNISALLGMRQVLLSR